ncbi:MAG: alpha/beta hydrolase-fold protein [Gammaproteobacteria bacterium]|jgi:poly(3-hydroxybutyrate) depolymerase|nr:alpha/beta hydrolase-fold protein [Gammaproteobacteria bacterium]
MIKFSIKILSVITLLTLLVNPSFAEVSEDTREFGGLDVRFRIILPDNYDPTQTYPTVLQFPGGSQSWNIVAGSTDADWREKAERDGYIVISPSAPNGQLFFQGGDRVFPEFLDYIRDTYPVADNKLHITGISNGGLSAFHVASLYPDYFTSVTGYPGLLNGASDSRLEALRPLCIYMHVGDRDSSWRSAMQNQYQALQERGYNISFNVETDQNHVLDVRKNNLRERLFAELDRARTSCSN